MKWSVHFQCGRVSYRHPSRAHYYCVLLSGSRQQTAGDYRYYCPLPGGWESLVNTVLFVFIVNIEGRITCQYL